jgi:hypothetical protein
VPLALWAAGDAFHKHGQLIKKIAGMYQQLKNILEQVRIRFLVFIGIFDSILPVKE